MSGWTDDRILILIRRWENGDPVRAIALALDITRSAVIGKANRLKLPTHASKSRPKKSIKVKRARKLREKAMDKPMEFPIYASDDDIPIDQRRRLLDLEYGQCKWPLGDPLARAEWFCGGEASGPYCQYHARIAYRPLTHAAQRTFIPARGSRAA